MVPREISKQLYKSKQWKKTRAAYIASVCGLCERCLAQGKVVQGYIVHHKTYVTEDNITDPNVTLNFDNLEYLCFACHQEEHFGSVEFISENLQFDKNGDLVQSPLNQY